jgi:hypothetical protein
MSPRRLIVVAAAALLLAACSATNAPPPPSTSNPIVSAHSSATFVSGTCNIGSTKVSASASGHLTTGNSALWHTLTISTTFTAAPHAVATVTVAMSKWSHADAVSPPATSGTAAVTFTNVNRREYGHTFTITLASPPGAGFAPVSCPLHRLAPP